MALTPNDLVLIAEIEEKLAEAANSLRASVVALKGYQASLNSTGNLYTKEGVQLMVNYIKAVHSMNSNLGLLNDFVADLYYFSDRALF